MEQPANGRRAMSFWFGLLLFVIIVFGLSVMLNVIVRKLTDSYQVRPVFTYLLIPLLLVGAWIGWSWDGLLPWSKGALVFVGPILVIIFAGLSGLSNLLARKLIK